MHECFYVESQGGAYTHDIFAVELLDDRRFTRVVETAVTRSVDNCTERVRTDRNNILISLSFRRLLRIIVSKPI